VPHATTLVKLTRRVGPATVAQLNQVLLAKAATHKVLRTHKIRADTTVVEANVCYPTDAGLLAKAVGTLAHTIGRVQAAGGPPAPRCGTAAGPPAAAPTSSPGRCGPAPASQTAGRRAHCRAGRLGRAGRRRRHPGGPQRPPAACPRWQPGLRQAGQAVEDLETTIGRTGQVIGQARTRLAGQVPDGATRLVSLHDPDARPIVKGRLGKPVEFGYKAQVVDNPDGVVLDYLVEVGNPADAPLLVPAIERISQQTGRVPGPATADRGYGEAAVDDQLHALGVERVAIPRKGTPSAARQAHEHTRSFRRLVKWRTGSEGRISHLKQRYGWDRTLMDGIDGARICGQGVFAHNLVKISGLLQAKQQRLAACR